MWLFRFAIISIHGQADAWESFSLGRDNARVRVLQRMDDAGGVGFVVGSEIALDEMASVDDERLVLVPDARRRLAQEAIDVAANLLSVATGHARLTTSPNLPVAF
jgi:hypothetical protein